MITLTVCLGSNAQMAAHHIDKAVDFISAISEIKHDTGPYLSDPEKSASGPCYTNRILILKAAGDCDYFHSLCKHYESLERCSTVEEGRVTIDIDIVVCDGEVLRPLDFASAYFRKGIERLKI